MKFMCALTVLIYAAASSPASALEDHERVQVATALGNVLAFEEACDLNYNQDAIAAFIEEKVPADDIEFPGILSTMSGGAKYLLKNLTGSEKTAQCAQIRRIAKSYGFTR